VCAVRERVGVLLLMSSKWKLAKLSGRSHQRTEISDAPHLFGESEILTQPLCHGRRTSSLLSRHLVRAGEIEINLGVRPLIRERIAPRRQTFGQRAEGEFICCASLQKGDLQSSLFLLADAN
jgi:hypothetical protein